MASEAAVEAVGGAVGAVTALAATYPLAIVSTWQALEHAQGVELATDELRRRYAFLPSPLKELAIYSESRGWRSLFAGLKPCLAATAVSQAVYFYLYSALRQAIVAHKRATAAARAGTLAPGAAAPDSSRTEAIGVVGSLVVAGLAGCGNVLATTPVWVVATQMQALQRQPTAQERNRTAWQVAVQLYKESGIAGFWKGVLPGLVMVANPTLQYILYEWLTAQLLQLRRGRAGSKAAGRPGGGGGGVPRLGTGDVFLLTALAKLGATLVTYPMLLIKSRLQAMNSSTAHEARYSGVLDAVVAILRREGVAAFFKGMRLKMFQTVLAAALLMAIKEQVYLSTKTVMGGLTAMRAVAVAAEADSG
ncbi:hypothetical protein PLESTB_001607100 [Pleodorina starrii]|uniref:Uncharacterized protein n=1 Tax=Pleodorina starrii TaxID=330485 RepID=A0A9W6F958_9CHLO|nr:hypothetical protein PLESTM_000173500 [Pleodorina starrii]GLC60390.1 hypothetical protein PLESTB_001607100 [Pleodorina starrii]GLC64117.1 hypothetical protein PLESTF_000126300 [Pleodorina starrii]